MENGMMVGEYVLVLNLKEGCVLRLVDWLMFVGKMVFICFNFDFLDGV